MFVAIEIVAGPALSSTSSGNLEIYILGSYIRTTKSETLKVKVPKYVLKSIL